jgi:hypothetical protein
MKPEFDRRDAVSEDGLNFHRSPPEAIPTLLSIERPVLRRFAAIDEPACGDGALVLPLRTEGFSVIASDIVDRGCPGATVRDFCMGSPWFYRRDRGCITNPPFNRAEEFVVLACARYDYVAMILRLRYLGPQHFIGDDGAPIVSGRPIWTGTRIPFARIILPASRWPMMHRDDYEGEKVKGGMTDSCWFIWERGHKGPPLILREPRSDILKRSLDA